jgi:hypothetical protein
MDVTGTPNRALTVKTNVPTQCTPPFPKNQQASAPLRERGSAAASPPSIVCDVAQEAL